THRLLFAKPGRTIAIQNLGGIGNVTLLRGNRVELAFDTGPGNVWIDTVVRWKSKGKRSFDPHGRIARKVKPQSELVSSLLRHSYFRQRPPKSAGWEQFGPTFLRKYRRRLHRLSLEDAVATVTHATAEATAQAYKKFVIPRSKPKEIIFCGGG